MSQDLAPSASNNVITFTELCQYSIRQRLAISCQWSKNWSKSSNVWTKRIIQVRGTNVSKKTTESWKHKISLEYAKTTASMIMAKESNILKF